MRVLFSYVVCPVVTIQREPVSAVSSDINFPMKGRRGMKDWARTAEDKLYIPKEVFTIPPEGKKKRKCGLSTDQGWSKFLGCQFQLINTRSYVFLCLAFFSIKGYYVDIQAAASTQNCKRWETQG